MDTGGADGSGVVSLDGLAHLDLGLPSAGLLDGPEEGRSGLRGDRCLDWAAGLAKSGPAGSAVIIVRLNLPFDVSYFDLEGLNPMEGVTSVFLLDWW